MARTTHPEHYPAFATMLCAGIRIGEALALLPGKVDLKRRTTLIDRQLTVP